MRAWGRGEADISGFPAVSMVYVNMENRIIDLICGGLEAVERFAHGRADEHFADMIPTRYVQVFCAGVWYDSMFGRGCTSCCEPGFSSEICRASTVAVLVATAGCARYSGKVPRFITHWCVSQQPRAPNCGRPWHCMALYGILLHTIHCINVADL